ncbi:HAD hydrolase-like protein [Candidatus Woesearchaeota archaeon]|nr:HAD hydrolase-like protein [Candidatus Woesearchaeota archaeon]
MNKLVLFDIDGTLVTGATAHKEAFTAAFKAVYGIDAIIDTISPAGKTDQQIIREVLVHRGLADSEITPKIQECMKAMVNAYKNLESQYQLATLPGVPELLSAMTKRGAILGLVTGNLEPIARKKMQNVGLDKYFPIGGFGSDHENRAELVKLAVSQASKKGFIGKDIYLFGDTPYDIAAGKAANAITIGVATGSSTTAQLIAAGANHVVQTLTRTNEILQLVYGR